jgi:nucleoside-diphosphate-sugar epimerase
VIPTIASQLLSGANELRLGTLTPTRDFNYVTNTASAFMALADCDAAIGDVVNIGSGEDWSIEQTARLLMEVTGRSATIVSEESRTRPAASEVNRLLADAGKMRRLTGWAPEVSFRDGLARTAEWIGRNLHHFEPSRYTV